VVIRVTNQDLDTIHTLAAHGANNGSSFDRNGVTRRGEMCRIAATIDQDFHR